MTFEAERVAIEGRFHAQWLTGSPAALRTPVGWDGHTFKPPTDESSIRLTILDGDSFNASFGDPGSNKVRYAGAVMLEVYTVGGQGSNAAQALKDLIRPIFTNWRSGDLLFRTMRQVSAPDTTPPYYKITVHFPFQRDANHG